MTNKTSSANSASVHNMYSTTANKSILDEAIVSHQQFSGPSEGQLSSYHRSLELLQNGMASTGPVTAASPMRRLGKLTMAASAFGLMGTAIGIIAYAGSFTANGPGHQTAELLQSLAPPVQIAEQTSDDAQSPQISTKVAATALAVRQRRVKPAVQPIRNRHGAQQRQPLLTLTANKGTKRAASSQHSLLVQAEWALRGGHPQKARILLAQFAASGKRPKHVAALEVLIACRLGEDATAILTAFLNQWPGSSFEERFRRECPSPLQ